MTIVNAVEVIDTPVKPNNGNTLIHLVLDETGSMDHVRQQTINSINEYLNSQRGLPGECNVTLTTFDVGRFRPIVRDVFRNLPIHLVLDLTTDTYRPYGSTNLYDAIGYAISTTSAELEALDTVPNVLLVIITDGEENSSEEYSLSHIQNLIAEKQKENWTIVYLGANQDAWQVGRSFGLSKGQTKTYSTDEMNETMRGLSVATASYRSARSSASVSSVEQNFFEEESSADNTLNTSLSAHHNTHIPVYVYGETSTNISNKSTKE
jgi:hypothetical protein